MSGFLHYSNSLANSYSLIDWASQSKNTVADDEEINPANKKQFLALVARSEGTLASRSYTSQHGFNKQRSLLGNSSKMLLSRGGRKAGTSSLGMSGSGKISGVSFLSLNRFGTAKSSHQSYAHSSTNFLQMHLRKEPIKDKKELRKEMEKRLNALARRIENSSKRKIIEETTIQIEGVRVNRMVYQPRLHHNDQQKIGKSVKDYSFLVAKGSNYDDEAKTQGKPCQDCISTAAWKDFECVVVCDGHGRGGHEVAWQVSNFISGQLILKISDEIKLLKKDVALLVEAGSQKVDLDDKKAIYEKVVTDKLFFEVFQKCDDEIIWSSELRNLTWAKIIGGKYEGLLCHIVDESRQKNEIIPEGDLDDDIPVTIFPNGQRDWVSKPWTVDRESEIELIEGVVKRKYLLSDRPYYGGTTCVAFIRERSTNQCRVATAGDSRIMYIPKDQSRAKQLSKKGAMYKIIGRPDGLTPAYFKSIVGVGPRPIASITVEHNIHVKAELNRIKRDFPGKFVLGHPKNGGVSGYLYSNALFPYTGGITPSRGFGDRLYFGSGLISKPEVSEIIQLQKGDVVVGGSDGIFDDSVWGKNTRSLLYYIADKVKKGINGADIAQLVFDETTRRCHDWAHFRTDDISMFILDLNDRKKPKV
eukprot:maker-scaffold_14-snap-gene-6.47-mRNA-1 protein AED:0.04 eAED:0.04 QI:0/0.5/0.66/1/1/1/3/41/642